MRTKSTLLIASTVILLGVTPSIASSQAFSCSDASGDMNYDGEQLTYRNAETSPEVINVKSRKISETPLATIEETCTNKAGQKFTAGSKTSLLVLEYPQSWDQKLVQGQFLCVQEFDTYPNQDGVDTKCIKTSTRTERLRDTTLVTETKNK